MVDNGNSVTSEVKSVIEQLNNWTGTTRSSSTSLVKFIKINECTTAGINCMHPNALSAATLLFAGGLNKQRACF